MNNSHVGLFSFCRHGVTWSRSRSRKIVADVGCSTLVPRFDHKIALKGTLARRLDFLAQMTALRPRSSPDAAISSANFQLPVSPNDICKPQSISDAHLQQFTRLMCLVVRRKKRRNTKKRRMFQQAIFIVTARI